MIQEIEIDIQKNLRTQQNLQTACNSIWEKWKDARFDLPAVNSFSAFLFAAQEWKKLISLSLKQLENKDPVGWNFLAEAINKVPDDNLKARTLNVCLKYFRELGNEVPYILSTVFDVLSADPASWRNYYQNAEKRKIASVREQQMAHLNMFRHNQSFSDAEKLILVKLEKTYPRDKEIMSLIEEARMKEINAVLKKYGNNYEALKAKQNPHQKAEAIFKQNLLNESKRIIRSEPAIDPYDFVVFFIFIEAYEEALQVLTMLEPTQKTIWLQLDLLVLAKHFLHALVEIEGLIADESLVDHVQRLCLLQYYKAICLWGLGENKTAMQTLDELLDLNPDYKTAQQLSSQWKRLA